MGNKIIIFSDIDGTLIDLTTFDPGPVVQILPLLQKKVVPVILCSAKTAMEQIKLRKMLSIQDPFIVENGGGIYIPNGYFEDKILKSLYPNITYEKEYIKIKLGKPYKYIRQILKKIKDEEKISILGFGDLDIDHISKLTGLPKEDASLAKNREFDETILEIDIKLINTIKKRLKEYGLKLVHGGRFYHILDKDVSKGKSIKILKQLFQQKYGTSVETIGIGDSLNDLDMLKSVDHPYVVEKKSGGWNNFDIPNLKKMKGIGPYGWINVIKDIGIL